MSALPPPAIAKPQLTVFGSIHCVWATLAILAMVAPTLLGKRSGLPPQSVCLLLVPVLLAIASAWVGRAPRFVGLWGRSVLAHFGAFSLAGFVMMLARIGSPGSSSHGGIVLGILILVPFAGMAAAAFGLVAAASSFVSTKALDEGGR